MPRSTCSKKVSTRSSCISRCTPSPSGTRPDSREPARAVVLLRAPGLRSAAARLRRGRVEREVDGLEAGGQRIVDDDLLARLRRLEQQVDEHQIPGTCAGVRALLGGSTARPSRSSSGLSARTQLLHEEPAVVGRLAGSAAGAYRSSAA